MLLFALYIVFIGLCYHQYNGNFLYDSRFLKNDSISRKELSMTCSGILLKSGCCIRLYLKHRSHKCFQQLQRLLFTKTGIWNGTLDRKLRQDIEHHWLPIIIKENERINSENYDGSKRKFYVLSMFPYPSGRLHMGHARVYTLSDTMARFQRLRGYYVIHPVGWDAFGLPAENAAIERQEKPDEWTYRNISQMRKQLEQLACSFDWQMELTTCDPSYYKWTQYFFLKMFEAGLVYQKQAKVFWDPVDQTVLAEEQIDENGCSWRSGAVVEKKFLRQWYIRTTAKAKSLYDGLSEVDPELWRDIIKIQRNWIGQCIGTRIEFHVESLPGKSLDPIDCFTAFPEAIYGVAFIALSPSHHLSQSDFYQSGFESGDSDIILSLKAIHPITGDTIPLVVSRSTQFDEFNDTFLGIPSVDGKSQELADKLCISYQWVVKDVNGTETLINSNELNCLTREQGSKIVLQKLQELGVGGHVVSHRLHDWLISRQRYWGTPIPVVHCSSCKAVPVPYEELPVLLPKVELLTGQGPSPLSRDTQWVNTTCPRCGGVATRETDTMDTFVDSSWYFLRYLDTHNSDAPFNKETVDKFMPVDLYIGGKEHAVLHLYFARFFCHFLHDEGFLGRREPFADLLTQGMVLGQSYLNTHTGKYLSRSQIDFTGKHPVERGTSAPVEVKWEKMSKSKHNGVDPDDVIEEMGVDTARLSILANVSPLSDRRWSNDVCKGIMRWQQKIWNLVGCYVDCCSQITNTLSCDPSELAKWNADLKEARNNVIREVTFHFSRTYLISSSISYLQSYTTLLNKVPEFIRIRNLEYLRSLADLIILISPMAPCFSAEMWQALASASKFLRHSTDYEWDKIVLSQRWPNLDADFKLPLILKINKSKTFFSVHQDVFASLTADSAMEIVQQDVTYQKHYHDQNMAVKGFTMFPSYRATLLCELERSKSDLPVIDRTGAVIISDNI